MEAFLAYTFSIYSAILVPFGTPDFGPKLATGLLALAAAVFLGFFASRCRNRIDYVRPWSRLEASRIRRPSTESEPPFKLITKRSTMLCSLTKPPQMYGKSFAKR